MNNFDLTLNYLFSRNFKQKEVFRKNIDEFINTKLKNNKDKFIMINDIYSTNSYVLFSNTTSTSNISFLYDHTENYINLSGDLNNLSTDYYYTNYTNTSFNNIIRYNICDTINDQIKFKNEVKSQLKDIKFKKDLQNFNKINLKDYKIDTKELEFTTNYHYEKYKKL